MSLVTFSKNKHLKKMSLKCLFKCNSIRFLTYRFGMIPVYCISRCASKVLIPVQIHDIYWYINKTVAEPECWKYWVIKHPLFPRPVLSRNQPAAVVQPSNTGLNEQIMTDVKHLTRIDYCLYKLL